MNPTQRKKIEAATYNETINQDRPEFKSFFDRELYNRLYGYAYRPYLDRLGRRYLKGRRVLILGAGWNNVAFVKRFTEDLVANNISKRELDLIRQKYPDTQTRLADAENLTTETLFDVVFCSSILHHLHPIDGVLEKLSCLLQPNGYLFIHSEPGYYHPFAYIGRRLTPSNTHTPGERAFNFYHFETLLRRWYQPVSIRYFFLLSVALTVIPTRFSHARPICARLLKPTLAVETFLARLPFAKNLFWITAGVYRRR